MPMVFICYRRDDSSGTAGRVHDRLAQAFGDNLLFMDVDNIPLGSDFVDVLRDAVTTCEVLLAVIGQHWLDARGTDGNRRLDDENDFVRIEIATALQRNIPVIPILVDGAKIPKAAELTRDLQGLSTRSGLDVRHASFQVDMDRLINGLKVQMGGAIGPSVKPTASASAWTATLERNSMYRTIWTLRNSNEVHTLELTKYGLSFDGHKISELTPVFFSSQSYVFTIKDTKFDLIREFGLFSAKSTKILANGIHIYEWKNGGGA